MIILIGDDNSHCHCLPIVTYPLIALNLLVYGGSQHAVPGLEQTSGSVR